MLTIEWVNNPIYANNTGVEINLTVKFTEFNEPMLFTATPYDPEVHGRELHANAVAGEYGPIAPYILPAPPEGPLEQPATTGTQTL